MAWLVCNMSSASSFFMFTNIKIIPMKRKFLSANRHAYKSQSAHVVEAHADDQRIECVGNVRDTAL